MQRTEIVERDEGGEVLATYVVSSSDGGKGAGGRVDVIRPKNTKSMAQRAFDVFLPAGYPQSVSEDYMAYQVYDSLQAFSSSIAGLLASRAVLQGVGVGDASASPTAALLLSVAQESMGRVATIVFAHRLGTALEPECKMYRLLADVLNDAAMVLDCLSPAFPKATRVLVLGVSSVLRALCGVCAGSAKASLSAHFARRGNLGELNAKDSSQETVVSLLGMLAGSVVVSWITTPMATWSTLIALLSVHLATNYAAVRAVSMRSLNRQRANIVVGGILRDGEVLSPTQVSQRERIFESDGILRGPDNIPIGRCKIGVSIEEILSRMSLRRHKQTSSLDMEQIELPRLLELFADEPYILWFAESGKEALIALKKDCSPVDQLQAWTQALLLAQLAHITPEGSGEKYNAGADPGSVRHARLNRTLEQTRVILREYAGRLIDSGWDLETAALQTRVGSRTEVISVAVT